MIDEFRAQPERFVGAVAALETAALRRPVAAGEWSPHQIVVHVVACDAEALLPRLRRIREEERPRLPNWDEEAWTASGYDPTVELKGLLTGWKRARGEEAEVLEAADPTDWNRVGIHPVKRERTLLWWLEYAVAHAREHLEQLAAGSAP